MNDRGGATLGVENQGVVELSKINAYTLAQKPSNSSAAPSSDFSAEGNASALVRSFFRRPPLTTAVQPLPATNINSSAIPGEQLSSARKSSKSDEYAELRSWLESKGLSKYSKVFEKAGANMALLPYLTEEDLKEMGVTTLGARKKVLLGAAELKGSDVAKRQTGTAAYNIAAYFSSTNPQPDGTIHKFLDRPAGAPPLKKPAAKRSLKPDDLPPAKKTAAKKSGWAHDAARGDERGKRWRGGKAAAIIPFKPWQLVSGCPSFVVDRFCNLPPTTPQHRHWFLTHFHADHYKGLTSKFNRGTIYCTPITAALIHQQLRVPKACIQEIQEGVPTYVEGVKVTFIDANHCPGAVMILFQPQGRFSVLHSGDCRLTQQMQQHPVFQAVRGQVDLVLDTTYGSPEYSFPPQEKVIKFVLDAVKAESFNPKTLFMFGSYTIGKERVYLEVARTLNTPVYASATKRKVLDCLDLDEETKKLLTTDDEQSNLHVVPMWMVSQKHMANVLRHYRGRFTTVVGFQPTGWTHQRDAGNTKKRGRRQQKGTLITYQVPYSEHSSFTELKEFVAWLQPRNIIPSVNSDAGGPKAQKLVALVRGH